MLFMRLKTPMTLICTTLLLTACDSGHTYAPVAEVNTIQSIPKAGSHTVVKGETLYAIAWRYGLDYRFLADRNHISPPYAIHPGQVIYLRNVPSQPVSVLPTQLSSVEIKSVDAKWIWPTKGKVINRFSASNKGVNISGLVGQPIYAAAAGKVVYCGNGLRGYGNLIILKHNSIYLSAYAHNRVILVKEGDSVMKGQKIAEMGDTGTDKVNLHFEIRRAGNPVDPLLFYTNESGDRVTN